MGKEKFSEETVKKAMPHQTKARIVYYCRSKAGFRNQCFKKPLKGFCQGLECPGLNDTRSLLAMNFFFFFFLVHVTQKLDIERKRDKNAAGDDRNEKEAMKMGRIKGCCSIVHQVSQ